MNTPPIYAKTVANLPITAITCLLIIAGLSFTATAQKKPKIIKSNLDASELCSGQLSTKHFCKDLKKYQSAIDGKNFDEARFYRNESIKSVILEVNYYFESKSKKKKFRRKLLRTIFDVLEISAAVAIGITNGERVKTIIAEGLTGFQAGRTSFSKNFDLLRTQILINKMRENRALELGKIYGGMNKPIETYSWSDAKINLQAFFFAGTFSHALDSLAKDTGGDANDAEKGAEKLRKVVGTIIPESTADDLTAALNANSTMQRLITEFADANTEAAARATANKILVELQKDEVLKNLVSEANLTPANISGSNLIAGLKAIRRQAIILSRTDMARKINDVINKIGNE